MRFFSHPITLIRDKNIFIRFNNAIFFGKNIIATVFYFGFSHCAEWRNINIAIVHRCEIEPIAKEEYRDPVKAKSPAVEYRFNFPHCFPQLRLRFQQLAPH